MSTTPIPTNHTVDIHIAGNNKERETKEAFAGSTERERERGREIMEWMDMKW